MLNLSRGIKAYYGRRRENRRQIERQKNMLVLTDIVLVDDFYRHAVEPALARHKIFSSIFGENGHKIGENLEYLIATKQIPTFQIPYSALKGAAKERADEIIKADVERQMKIAQMGIERMAKEVSLIFGLPVHPNAVHVNVEDTRQQFTEQIQDMFSMPAVYKNDMLLSANLVRDFPIPLRGGIERYETASLLWDEGHHAVEFWKDVNALTDYSGLFPNKPRIPKGPDDRSGRSRAWKPGLLPT